MGLFAVVLIKPQPLLFFPSFFILFYVVSVKNRSICGAADEVFSTSIGKGSLLRRSRSSLSRESLTPAKT